MILQSGKMETILVTCYCSIHNGAYAIIHCDVLEENGIEFIKAKGRKREDQICIWLFLRDINVP